MKMREVDVDQLHCIGKQNGFQLFVKMFWLGLYKRSRLDLVSDWKHHVQGTGRHSCIRVLFGIDKICHACEMIIEFYSQKAEIIAKAIGNINANGPQANT